MDAYLARFDARLAERTEFEIEEPLSLPLPGACLAPARTSRQLVDRLPLVPAGLTSAIAPCRS